jgi:hypothetical protein
MSNYYMFYYEYNPIDPNKWIAHKLDGCHVGELLWGFGDDDYFYQTKRLKSNWKVSYIDLTREVDNWGGATLMDSRPGTDSPYAKVHWWVEPISRLHYYISWHIEGPKGTSYY